MTEHEYRLNPMTGTFEPVGDAPVYEWGDGDTVIGLFPDPDGTIIFDYDL